ncbi:MAG: response regulator [Candidatus Omnitrophica bacterium]|nr:response regulator [Candidatus Omnitrophota bacterium]
MPDDKKPILVIDDEEGACEFIKSFLEDREYTVITALNGKDGINIIKEKNPSLVFLDIRMPEMSGIDVLAELKNQNINTNIILMTGMQEGEELDKAKSFGVKGVIKKPIELMELSAIIKEHIQ